MKAPLLFSLAALVLAAGCGEKSSSPEQKTNAAASGGSVVTAPVDYLNAVAKGQQDAVKTIDTTSITKAIELFQVDKGRNPKDLNELVQEKFLAKIPDTPYGTKLDYDPATGQVRIVKQ